ncbi:MULTISPECIES: phage antirepressor KilAC domain-containing protein [Lysinibacillus]|uniref:Phage antirepressor KilAC domain-containing protein n=1 Tax=Lysinibacillus capsici TaxID=2115968 RepID=A0ABY8KL59_9BACI|nr:phage antirepressor KilAC domain-containing protein [Lysinibacillus capsici]WGF40228.1 phage antirepressor KilAC domain-containing protein [Lysinibacillus capsici]
MNELKTFNHQMFGELPVLIVDEIEWFGATEAAKALSFSDPHKAIKNHVEDEGWTIHPVLTNGGKQQKKFVNESGLYELILGAAKQGHNPEIKEKAKKFKRWVTSEVLPSIRRDGAYVHATEEDDDTMIMARGMQAAQRAIERKDKLIAEQKEKLEQQRPKVVYADAVEVSEDTVLVKDLATVLRQKGVNIGEVRLFRWLRENGYLCKQKGEMWNMPTQRSLDLGIIVVKHGLRTGNNGEMKKTRTPKITGKGQIYITNKILAEHGLLVV